MISFRCYASNIPAEVYCFHPFEIPFTKNEIFTELDEYKIVFGKVEKVFDITNRTFDFRASVLKKSYAIYDVNTRK